MNNFLMRNSLKNWICIRMSLGAQVITQQDIVNDELRYYKLHNVSYDLNEVVLTVEQLFKNWKAIRKYYKFEFDYVDNKKQNFRLTKRDQILSFTPTRRPSRRRREYNAITYKA